MSLNVPQTKEINCAITQPTSVIRKYNSTHSGLLADIFGEDPRFAGYDVLNTEIKSKQGKVSMSHYNGYKDILAELQSKLLIEKSVVLQQLNAIAIHIHSEANLPHSYVKTWVHWKGVIYHLSLILQGIQAGLGGAQALIVDVTRQHCSNACIICTAQYYVIVVYFENGRLY